LEPVFEAEPPEELRSLRFGDPYMLARKAYEPLEKTDGETGRSYLRCNKCKQRLDPTWRFCPYCAREAALSIFINGVGLTHSPGLD
jgi:hypothetical protein